jgi:hypothetical protein
MCNSFDVTRTKYLGGVIVWFICRQCAHVFYVPTPFQPN